MIIAILPKIRTKHPEKISYNVIARLVCSVWPICTGSHGVMKETMKSNIIDHVTPCILLAIYYVSAKRTASIYRMD
jgi:hypothetical protein